VNSAPSQSGGGPPQPKALRARHWGVGLRVSALECGRLLPHFHKNRVAFPLTGCVAFAGMPTDVRKRKPRTGVEVRSIRLLGHIMRRPILFLYSLIFPAVWICCSILFATLCPGKHLGTLGSALFIIGIASLISWLFARRQRRDFSSSEYLKIILYCIGWALFLEFLSLKFILSQPEAAHDLNFRTLFFIASFTVTLDSLFVWLAFRNFGRRVIRWYLATHEVANDTEKNDDVA